MDVDTILEELEEKREQFLEAIDGLPEAALLEAGVVGEWSIKDLIAHLSMWEAWLVKLLWQISQGQAPTRLYPAGDIDQVNAAWRDQAKERTLEQVFEDYRQVRKQTIRRLQSFSERDLNDPQRYPWADGHPLLDLVADNTFGHEAEHTAQVLAWRQQRGL